MNQPASKEPTMDEILSSIRQIIADDDEAAAQKMPSAKPTALKPVPAPEPVAQPAAFDIDPFADDDDEVAAPLALSPEQIVEDLPAEEPAPVAAKAAEAAPDMVVPDDVAFAQDAEEEPQAAPAAQVEAEAQPEPQPEPEPMVDTTGFADAAPMPDRDLSADLAAELLEPATSAAVRSAFSKLSTPKVTPDLPLGAGGLTIEAMIREMLRPMLKEWLDENLPSMVERLVAQEIERVSRGG